MTSLFHTDLPVLDLIFRGLLIYLSVLLLLRISGKRQIGQMGATEFVAILLISNAVQNAMNGGDNTLLGGIVLAITLVALSSLISFLTFRSKLASKIFEGTPTLIIHKGKILPAKLHHEWMSATEVRTLLRKQGVHDLREIETAILEADGTLSVTRVNEPHFS